MNIQKQFNLKEIYNCAGVIGYEGFTHLGGRDIYVESDWVKEFAFCDHPYRIIWINISEMGIFTFTEGDLRLEYFTDRVAFYEKLAKCAEFYKNN
jgi:hypothetical protein